LTEGERGRLDERPRTTRWSRAFPALVVLAIASPVAADPALALLAPAADARQAVALGPHGEIYRPDAGGWVRTEPFATADRLDQVGRAGSAIVAVGDGVVYKLAANGWSAIRLHQSAKATMSGGMHAVAAVRRQLYALDRSQRGEPAKLVQAPGNVTAIGASRSIVVVTERGVARIDGTKVTPIARAPRPARLVDDRWAIVSGGVYDLRAGKRTPWPSGAAVDAVASGPNDTLIVVARVGGKLELWTVVGKPGRSAGAAITREVIAVTPVGTAVGVVVDRADRATVALRDGRILVRERGTWTSTTVRDQLPTPHPGPPPARSG